MVLRDFVDAREVERAEGIPFGDDGRRVGGGDRFVGVAALLHFSHQWAGPLHAFGIGG